MKRTWTYYVCTTPGCSVKGTKQSSRTCCICEGYNETKHEVMDNGFVEFVKGVRGCVGTIIGIIVIIALLGLIFKC